MNTYTIQYNYPGFMSVNVLTDSDVLVNLVVLLFRVALYRCCTHIMMYTALLCLNYYYFNYHDSVRRYYFIIWVQFP